MPSVSTLDGWIAELVYAATTIRDRIDPVASQHAQQAAQRARSIVPVDTGRLRSSIEVERLPGKGVAWSVGSDLPYGRFVEFGTASMAPQPFLAPAGDAVAESFAKDALREAADL